MEKAKAPYRVLYSNDTTNIITCVSPFHKKGQPFSADMLRATVDETAGTGVEVHMLQPGLGWIPWWKSSIYPDHYHWFRSKYDTSGSDTYGDYMESGGDMVAVFVDRCREKGLVPFVSYRLNDHHGTEDVGKGTVMARHCVSRFYEEHPEYRIGPGPGQPNSAYAAVHNWAIPEVRKHKFDFIAEICENYDIDGLELDFVRHISFFRLDETSSAQRAAIMTGFVRQVRELLDSSAKPGRHRWLCVRVPCFAEAHDALGIDLPAMAHSGVEMVNLSPYYFAEQQTDLARIREMVPDVALYLEVTQSTALRRTTRSGYDTFLYRRMTDEQFYTAAHLAYARGGDGLVAFNFVYYREHGTPGRGPFNEPPFRVFKHLGDPEWIARQPQHYILGDVWNHPPLAERQLSKTTVLGEPLRFRLDMAPPAGGWKRDGRLRIQAGGSFGDSRFEARLNGVDLIPTRDVSEPYPNPYPPLLGKPEELCAWTVPAHLLANGTNEVEITMVKGEPAVLVFLDIAVE